MNRKFQGSIAVVLLSALLVGWSHFTLLSDPNNFFFDDSGDGFKNYFTLIYHVKHDSTYSHFEGMNYPYGEHVVFTDNQPLLSNSIKFISNNVLDISDHTVGIMNCFMLLSIILTCYFLYRIFRHFRLPALWAVLFAVGIGFMAPQIHRMSGHYALAYGFIIPLTFLLWLRYFDDRSLKRSLLLGIVVLLSSLLHMYYFALTGFFLGLYFLCSNLLNRDLTYLKSSSMHFFVQAILPLTVIQLWFFMTDDVGDRPSNPFGFLTYKAFWQGVFLPIGYPIGNFIHSIFPIKQIEWEGIAYIGIIPGVFFVKYALSSIRRFVVSKGKDLAGIKGENKLNYLLFISLFILLFSFGLPFVWDLEFLVQYLGPVKQFRGIARFSWIFYFGMCITGFIMFYRYVESKSVSPLTTRAVLSLGALLLFYEADLFHNSRPIYNLTTIPTLKSSNVPEYQKHPISNIDANRYQALLPLPYFHIGSENIGRNARSNSDKNSMIASVISGLPSCAVMMSRTSISQTLMNFNLTLEPYRSYEVFDAYPSQKPLLLWIEKNASLSNNELRLAQAATVIHEDETVKLAELSIKEFYGLLEVQFLEAHAGIQDSSLYEVDMFLTQDSIKNFHHEYTMDKTGKIDNWDDRFSGNLRDKNIIYESTLPNQDTVQYVMALWVKFSEDLHPTSRIFYDEFNETNELVYGSSLSYGEIVKLIDDDWALIEYRFKPLDQTNRLRFTIHRDIYQDLQIQWKGLLIRPEENDLFFRHDGHTVFKNGRTYGPGIFLKDEEGNN